MSKAPTWKDEQRAEALRLFRIMNGKGDSGSDAEFDCRRITEQAGWMALAAENAMLKGIIRNLREIVWEHHSAAVMTPDVCPVCTYKEFTWALDAADKALAVPKQSERQPTKGT